MSPIDLKAQVGKRRGRGCRRCGAPITVYLTAGAQRSADRVRVGSAAASFCDAHAVEVFEAVEKVLLQAGDGSA